MERLRLEIATHTKKFYCNFTVAGVALNYLWFRLFNRLDDMNIHIYKTSAKCYRVIMYYSRMSIGKVARYISFRSISQLCLFLDAVAETL